MNLVAGEPDATRSSGAETEPRGPVTVWALGGAAMVALMLYVYVSWIGSDDFRTTRTGADPVPIYVEVTAVMFQLLMVSAAVCTVAWVVRGCARARSLTIDGKLLIAWASMLWLDPMANYLRPQFLFNSYYVNRGSWVEHIPGWQSENAGELPGALLIQAPAYLVMVVTSVFGCHIMSRLRARRPDLGWVPLSAAVLAIFSAIFLVFGLFLVAIGFAAWPRALPYVSVGAGQWWQYPLSEVVMYGGVCTAMASLRFFRDRPDSPDAATFVERGAGRLPLGPRLRTAVCVLAVVGFGNLAMIAYSAVKVPIAVLVDPVSHDYPSYLRNGLCGPGTPYDC